MAQARAIRASIAVVGVLCFGVMAAFAAYHRNHLDRGAYRAIGDVCRALRTQPGGGPLVGTSQGESYRPERPSGASEVRGCRWADGTTPTSVGLEVSVARFDRDWRTSGPARARHTVAVDAVRSGRCEVQMARNKQHQLAGATARSNLVIRVTVTNLPTSANGTAVVTGSDGPCLRVLSLLAANYG